MSLPFGGHFDLDYNWNPNSNHYNHSYGTAVDVRGNNLVNAVPAEYLDDFAQICEAYGVIPGPTGVHDPGTSNQHLHCEWEPEFQTPPYPGAPCYAGN